MKYIALFLLLISTQAMGAGKIQNADVKSLSEITAAGGTSAQLINDTKIYLTGSSKQLSTAISDGTLTAASLPLAGGTLTGPVKFKTYLETVMAMGSVTGAQHIDFAAASVHSLTLTGALTLSFTNIPATGQAASVVMFFTQGGSGSYGITFPACARWAGGSAPTWSTTVGKTDVISCSTLDGGTSCYCFVGGIGF
jgi:hypothetical protein